MTRAAVETRVWATSIHSGSVPCFASLTGDDPVDLKNLGTRVVYISPASLVAEVYRDFADPLQPEHSRSKDLKLPVQVQHLVQNADLLTKDECIYLSHWGRWTISSKDLRMLDTSAVVFLPADTVTDLFATLQTQSGTA